MSKPSLPVAVFIHGFLGSAKSWAPLVEALQRDKWTEDHFRLELFEYSTPRANSQRRKRIPNLNELANLLATWLTSGPSIAVTTPIVLIGHSQGGLVIQRYLQKQLAERRGANLARIRAVILFATPNTGSEYRLSFRRRLWWLFPRLNPQEQTLRPFNTEVAETARIVQNQIVHAQTVSRSTCPIRFEVFAGESDGVVTPASAMSVFPNAGTLPGDHSSLIDPNRSGKHVTDVLLESFRRASTALVPDATLIDTERLHSSDSDAVRSVLQLLHDAFEPDATVSKEPFEHWLSNYEEHWGDRFMVIVARVNGNTGGCAAYHIFEDVMVVDYLVVGADSGEAREFVRRKLGARLRSEANEFGVDDVLFEVAHPEHAVDDRAIARIRLFQRDFGARVVAGVEYRAINMRSPSRTNEKPYLLMYISNGKMPTEIPAETVKGWVELLYKKWYRQWLWSERTGLELDRYLSDICTRVSATVRRPCRLDVYQG